MIMYFSNGQFGESKMANLLPSSRKPASHRRPVFNLPTASMKRKPSSKPGLEPLREGDDVNLASECEDNPGQFPAKPSKANNEAATSPMPKARGKQSNATQTLSKATSKNESSSVNESQGKINQVCLITIIVILLLMLIATSTTTVVVILHWSGKVTWVPALSKALHG
ncbi:hypothetical protein Q1695_015117 [Nippostrongylus brasiliensis]|nr:hypothetical protein Q1695_015117 [Nippostrongylus brasiliensis]